MNDEEFKKRLNPEQYRIMRHGGMEIAFTGRYWKTEERGTYRCAACGNPLFRSKDKFDAGTGWPTFRKSLSDTSLEYKQDANAAGDVEMRCKKCHSNIGLRISEDGSYRANSIALDLEESDHAAVLEGVKDNLETAKDTYDDQRESREQDAEQTSAFASALGWISGFSQFFGGAAFGAVVGAAAALFFCYSAGTVVQSTNVQISTSTAATTSSPRVPPAAANQGTAVLPPATTTRPPAEAATTTIPADATTPSVGTPGDASGIATSTEP
ncbi:hypothetical protein A2763_01410 [Candidatus Kaiserbacteria bacterium RIFCSPHIGHO2_01_FULL_54_36]|uniref:peptide-methionine (R)-S-oxide reductase n=1 Tax=Candidatus Kaiserbacteria bacterium RIFCSPHIGHO2_01_FULL_54_36 TaxID=1798482 RepID=A0A1F6CM32_9BACT|nr:MAG: hypothetical protein A2763_01410 [Candidatus Kaiserbacteria bacterium RIFCSPHIGHO2_01_FULL_54_36]OGG75775.1 MAG: hypothetical protein A3A41_00180 [Candidatus Kaiserbacteria bacterium RIFCSPLOWO2_01_FULL_54_22]